MAPLEAVRSLIMEETYYKTVGDGLFCFIVSISFVIALGYCYLYCFVKLSSQWTTNLSILLKFILEIQYVLFRFPGA